MPTDSERLAIYDPLADFLTKQRGRTCTLTHANIEEILAARLPPSAKRDPAWWGNEADEEHVQRRSWLDAGWVVDDGCQAHLGVVRFFRRKKTSQRAGGHT